MGDCLDGSKLIAAQICKLGWGRMQESLGKCAGGSGDGVCGTAGCDGAIVRTILDSFGDMFGAGPRNVDAVTTVVVRVGSEIPTVDTVGEAGAMIAWCLVNNDAGARGC